MQFSPEENSPETLRMYYVMKDPREIKIPAFTFESRKFGPYFFPGIPTRQLFALKTFAFLALFVLSRWFSRILRNSSTVSVYHKTVSPSRDQEWKENRLKCFITGRTSVFPLQLEVLGIVASKNAIGGRKVLLLALTTPRDVLMHFII